MTRELTHQLERLGQERQRLEALLARVPSWQALMQLSSTAEPADSFSRYVRSRRRAELERELAEDPLVAAHRSVLSSIAVIEGLIADEARSGATLQLSDEVGHAPARPGGDEPASASEPSESVSHDVELLTCTGAAGGRLVTRNATIHKGLPGPPAAERRDESADAPPDPLTRIRRIDKGLAAALVARGVRHFAQIAAFGPADVRALSAALGLGNRISKENWIEQAAMLAIKAGADASVGMPAAMTRSAQSRPVHRDSADPAPAVAAIPHPADMATRTPSHAGPPEHASTDAEARSRADVAAAAASIAGAIADRHVGPAVMAPSSPALPPQAAKTAAQGVAAVAPDEDIAAFSALRQAADLDVNAFFVAEMVRDAAMRIAAQVQRPDRNTVSRPTVVDPPDARSDVVSSRHVEPSTAPATTATLPPAEPAPAETPVTAASLPAPDDLTRIDGIDSTIAAELAALGVIRFEQVAAWDAAAVARLSGRLGLAAQISQRGWIEQAAILAGGRDTHHAMRARRGEFAALVPPPSRVPARDEMFAAWLAAHALSHPLPSSETPGVEAPPLEPLGDLPRDSVAYDASPIPASALPEPLDAEYEDVSDAADTAAAEISHAQPAEQTWDMEPAPRPAPERASAEIIPLRRVITIQAQAPDVSGAVPEREEWEASDGVTIDRSTDEFASAVATGSNGDAPRDDSATDDSSAGSAGAGSSDDDAPSQAEHPLNIVDRITAIERGVEDLSAPPRLVLARFRDRAHLHTESQRVVTRAPTPSGEDQIAITAEDTANEDLTAIGDGYDDGDATAGEADVRIIMREAHAAGLAPSDVVPPPATDRDSQIDRTDYAAYRDVVEEASVEIVPAAQLDADTDFGAGTAGLGDAGTTKNKPPSPQEAGKVRRFLKALTGD